MEFLSNNVYGISFVGLALFLTLLMYHVWGYPYDPEKNRSTAPRALVLLHRALGYVFVIIYLYLMWEMVPRLWTYQVELPARTVVHLVLGMAIGIILVIKISIVRFFHHMEAQLVPYLGTSLLICTVLLIGLALPFQIREALLRDAALTGEGFSEERLVRVREQLPSTGLEDPVAIDALATTDALLSGRRVLTNKCVQCHDLRTILARPRPADRWRQTVSRMANRSQALVGITEQEEWQVTAYLIAISPTLQSSLMQKRIQDMASAETQQAVIAAGKRMMEALSEDVEFDLAAAQTVFEARCSQCHAFQLVQVKPPGSDMEAVDLVSRMVRNGLVAEDDELEKIIRYLTATYAAGRDAGGAPQSSNPDEETIPNPDDEPDGSSEMTDGDGAMPVADLGPVDRVITVRTAADDLAFEDTELRASVGETIKLLLDNRASGLTHNLILVRDESAVDDVLNESLGAADRGFVPEHPAVLASVPAIDGGGQGEVLLMLSEPGRYQYVCGFPAHGFTMRGTLVVE